MAVFLLNICKFNGCGITFPSLSDLITHIEDTHIDYDPKVIEQKEQSQPACLPLSYVLRFISDNGRKDAPYISANTTGVELKRKLAIKHHSYSMSSSNRSNTPTGSEIDDDEMVNTESEDSNESWTTEEFSSEFIMRYGSRHSGIGITGTPGHEKPFACPVPGCKKRYKNVNGIKYHSKNGHKKDGKVRKGYKCHCGKSYKTAQGLKNHALVTHNSSSNSDSNIVNSNVNGGVNTGGVVIVQRSSSPSQSLGSLSPSSISNMSSSASSCHGSNGNHNTSTSAVLQQLTNNNSIAGQTAVQLGNANLSIQQQLMNVTAMQNQNPNNSSNHHQIQQQQQQQQQQLVTSSNSHHHHHHNQQQTQPQTQSQPQSMAQSQAQPQVQPQQTNNQQLGTSNQTTDTTNSLQKLSSSLSSMMTSTSSLQDSSLNTATSAITTNSYLANNMNVVKKMSVTMPPQPLLGTTLRPIMPSTMATISSNTSLSTISAPPAASTAVASLPQFSAQAPMISPKFIEHKYSANSYKERFMSHIRNNQTNSTAATSVTASALVPSLVPPTAPPTPVSVSAQTSSALSTGSFSTPKSNNSSHSKYFEFDKNKDQMNHKSLNNMIRNDELVSTVVHNPSKPTTSTTNPGDVCSLQDIHETFENIFKIHGTYCK